MSAPTHTPTLTRLPLADRIAPWLPYALVPVLMVLGFFAIPSTSSWLTLTLAGLAMGMMIFVIASGMTLSLV